MYNDATAPDLGTGPYSVEHDEADSFYYLTRDGARTGKKYPIGKTAYRTARKLNDGEPLPTPAHPEDGPKGPAIPAPKASKPKKARKVATAPARPAQPAPAPEAPAPVAEALDLSGTLFTGTREEWLNAFVAAARPVFKQRGHELPAKVRVSVGFPLNHRRGKVIGQCWHETASADGTREIFVTPILDDSSRIADVLTHELAHTLFGPDEKKHGRNFKAAVTALGLVGKATSTEAGPVWHEWADPILQGLGAIPHAAIDPAGSGIKKQTTRLLKCECKDCGFTFRATAKWVSSDLGLRELRCPDVECGGEVEVTLPEGEGE